MANEERWADVPGFPGYQVSTLGDVRSVHPCLGRLGEDARILRRRFTTKGYPRVCLVRGKEKLDRLIHRLVLEAFVGPCPPGMEGRHILNNDPSDCRLVNLAWGTRSENHRDKRRHGTTPHGERHRWAKLSGPQIAEIRERRRQGETYTAIALTYGVHKGTIRLICLGKNWALTA